ncbi:MAG TPA: beta-ribofuranosylaminobenzene 5'-phosphate synthase family protein [Planctomycetaceae bacterium]|jgi:beta-RFAP synthase|nr:beta-ribofuranosylaminobenzene 5'-phosphate synthase family protein [Planctomycetaceae bacterium]
MRQITISTGARLHCGLLARGASSGRQFGGVGIMISPPGFVLRATRSSTEEAVGDECWRQRLLSVAARCRVAALPDRQPPPVRWELLETLPPHAGLGSGTQLGMAVAGALALLSGEWDVSAPELARRAGRGLRSAIGLYGFSQGGLLIEGGKTAEQAISPLVARAALPEDWRFLLIQPRDAAGLSGDEERQGFAHLPPMPATTTDRLCRLTLLNLLPAALEARFDDFGEALYEFGRRVGEYFAPAQGGTYADPRMRQLVPALHARGFRGIGQSSWGPTLFVLCPSVDAAQSLSRELATEHLCLNCALTIAAPRNRGADVEFTE